MESSSHRNLQISVVVLYREETLGQIAETSKTKNKGEKDEAKHTSSCNKQFFKDQKLSLGEYDTQQLEKSRRA